MTTTDTLALDLEPPRGGQILHATDRATVIWGDCRDPAVIAQVPAGYGLLCADPPYGVNYRSEYSRNFPSLVGDQGGIRSEEHTSELQSLMRISYAVFCLKKKKKHNNN